MSKYKVIVEYKSLNSDDYNRGEKPCDTIAEAKKFFEERRAAGIAWMKHSLEEEGFMWNQEDIIDNQTYFAYMSPTKRFGTAIAFYDNSCLISDNLFAQLYTEELNEAESKRIQKKRSHTCWPGYEEE